MPKKREKITRIELENIRRAWMEESGKYYYSVVDVIGILTDSADARNYWKVLKNRLKNTQNKLVTECNQLKLPSADGKFYLTDTAESAVMLEIINLVSPEDIATFRLYFNQLENKNDGSYPQSSQKDQGEQGEREESETKLLIDAFQTKDSIEITAMIAGVSKENISVVVTCGNVTIRGERAKKSNVSREIHFEKYSEQELYWGKFSRSIPLPAEIIVDSAKAEMQNGVLTIKLKKIDKEIQKIVEIKTN